MDILAARMGLGPTKPATEQVVKPPIRIHLPLSLNDPEKNDFDFAELLKKAKAERDGTTVPSSSGNGETSGVGESSALSDAEQDSVDKPKTTRRKKFDPEDEYDLDDDFIDDTDLFYAEVTHPPPSTWDYGFFAWKGPVENFFKEYNAKQQALEKEKAAAALPTNGRKKRGPRKEKKAASSSAPSSPPKKKQAASPAPTPDAAPLPTPTSKAKKKQAVSPSEPSSAPSSPNVFKKPLPLQPDVVPSTPTPSSPQKTKKKRTVTSSSKQSMSVSKADDIPTTPSAPKTSFPMLSMNTTPPQDLLNASPLPTLPPTAPSTGRTTPVAADHEDLSSLSSVLNSFDDDDTPLSTNILVKKKRKKDVTTSSKDKDKERKKRKTVPLDVNITERKDAPTSIAIQQSTHHEKHAKNGEVKAEKHSKGAESKEKRKRLSGVGESDLELKKKKHRKNKDAGEGDAGEDAHFVKSAKKSLGKSKKDKAAPQKAGLSLPSEVRDLMEHLAMEAQEVNCDGKTYPAPLKPSIEALVASALKHDCLDDTFFGALADILKMGVKATKRILHPVVLKQRERSFKAQLNEYYTLLRKHIDEKLPGQKKAFEEAMAAYIKLKQEDPESAAKAPEMRFRWNDTTRRLVWNILVTEWHAAELESDIKALTTGTERPATNELLFRKAAYAKLVTVWPDPWMDSHSVSREYSAFKRKLEKNPVPVVNSPGALTSAVMLPSGGIAIRPDPFQKKPRQRLSSPPTALSKKVETNRPTGASGSVSVEVVSKGWNVNSEALEAVPSMFETPGKAKPALLPKPAPVSSSSKTSSKDQSRHEPAIETPLGPERRLWPSEGERTTKSRISVEDLVEPSPKVEKKKTKRKDSCGSTAGGSPTENNVNTGEAQKAGRARISVDNLVEPRKKSTKRRGSGSPAGDLDGDGRVSSPRPAAKASMESGPSSASALRNVGELHDMDISDTD
ncbi:hypothetical protein HK104_008384 [Borealophlyctis nickersoniae]|nr:hypothetical protein HK104_008384 [Borealophlyctis nickersoniae]